MDSPEYQTLTQCYSRLVTCIQQSPDDIVAQLRPFGILTPRDLSYLSNPHHDNDEKAQRIVDSVLAQTKLNSQQYHIFTRALQAAGSWTKSAVSHLEAVYARLSELVVMLFSIKSDTFFACWGIKLAIILYKTRWH